MRFRQVAALLWEICYPSRWGLLGLGLLLPASVALVQWLSPELTAYAPVEGAVTLTFMVGLLYLVVVFSYAEISPRRLQTGFPQHLFRLPLPSWFLAAVPLVAGVASLLAYVVIWAALTRAVSIGVSVPFLVLAVGIATSWMQVLSWGLNRTPVMAGLVLIGVTLATVLCMATLSERSGTTTLIPRWAAHLVLAGLLLGGLAGNCLAVARTRSGSRFAGVQLPSLAGLPGFDMPRRVRGGAEAQFRYEWRMFGWLFPVSALALGGLLVFVQFLPPEDRIEASALVIGMHLYVAAFLGLELGKSRFRQSDFSMSAFWATRPLSDRDLAGAKLRLAATSVVLGTVILLIPLVPALFLAPDREAFVTLWSALVATSGSGRTGIVMAVGLAVLPWIAWILCANTMLIPLYGPRIAASRLVTAFGPAVVAAAAVVYAVSRSEPAVSFLTRYGPIVAAIPAIVAVVIAYRMIRRSGKSWRECVPGRLRAAGTGLMALGAGGLAQVWPSGESAAVGIIILANLVILGLFPMVAAPLALARNRHRQ